MASDQDDLYPLNSVSNSGAGEWVKVKTASMASVSVDFTGGSGSPSLTMWMEESHDDGVTAHAMAAKFVVNVDKTVSVDQVNLVTARTATSVQGVSATYPWVPAKMVRLAWTLAGSGPPIVTLKARIGFK